MYRYFLFLIIFLCGSQIYGQSPNLLARKKRTSKSYLEKTILFQIRAEHITDFKDLKENTPALKKLFTELGIKSIERRFPNHEAPKEKVNKHGQKLVDLSAIYFLTYKADLGIEDVILKMEKTGIFVYAEPWFKETLLYIPNDSGIQPTAPPGRNQFYLERMKAYEAWDICKGDTNVVIGIVDTGTKLDHEDLQGNIKYNYNDPIDGLDNDGDTYFDNFRGWDLGDRDNDPSANGDAHGAFVSGCAAASTDNSQIGIAGVGFKCKFMPVKAAADAQGSSIAYGYDGIIYAAEHGCDVINLSWGGPGSYSATGQNVINYAAINHNAVIIAAAGNSNLEEDYYPAAYDNVLSVGGVDTAYSPSAGRVIDQKWVWSSFGSTFSHSVGINAQSTRVFSTMWNGDYATGSGTSYASPLVAGAAGLVKTKFPSYTARQIIERLRVTADIMDTFPETIMYKEKLGKGIMNIYRALTDSVSPAVRMYSHLDIGKYGPVAFSGDTINVKCKFRNYLAPTSNILITMTSTSQYVTMIDSTTNLASIATLDSADNNGDPFTYYISPNAPLNTVITFRLGYKDGIYNDYQYYDFYVNPDYLTIDTNKVAMTVASDGRLGYNITGNGVGFVYKNNPLLYEGGLMIGKRTSKVSDCVRNQLSQDNDFNTIKSIDFIQPQYGSNEDGKTIFADTSITQKIGVKIDQRAIAWTGTPNDKYIIVEYNIKNISGALLDTLNVGIFADWDIGAAYDNRTDYDPATKLGYVYETTSSGLYAGISLVTNDKPSCYAMDHSNVGGNNINPNSASGFTTAKKLATLTNGIGRTQAGMTIPGGDDVSHVIGAELYNIQANETRTVAFAVLAGDNATDIKASAAAAYNKYKFYKASPSPAVSNHYICQKTPVNIAITPGNGTRFKFYNSLPAVNPVFVGSSYLMTGVSQADTIYVTGADSVFESNPMPVYIVFSTQLKADFVFNPDSLNLSSGNSVFFANQSQNASSILWDLGDASTSTAGSFLHTYNITGNYNIKLKATDGFGCNDSLIKVLKVYSMVTGINGPMENGIEIYPNPVGNQLKIQMDFNQQQAVSFTIMDMLGKEIAAISNANIQSDIFEFDFSKIPQGIYVVRFNIGGKTLLRKFVRE
jgi:serine protease